MDKIKAKLARWFARPLVRHAANLLIGLVLAQGLSRLGVDPATAHTVGQAVGRTVEG